MTMQVVTPSRPKIATHLGRVELMRQSAPRPLATVMAVLKSVLTLAGDEDFPQDRPRIRPVSGPGGTWRIARFSAHGQPWVGVEWPNEADSTLINWLTMVARDNGLDSLRPGVPYNQLWIHLGAS